jgi:hypothetical protein
MEPQPPRLPYVSSIVDQLLRSLFLIPTSPTNPVARRSMVAGSGTAMAEKLLTLPLFWRVEYRVIQSATV